MELFERLDFGKKVNLYHEIVEWQKINQDQKLYVWGTGSVAAGVIKECAKHDIELDGLFVNVTEYNLDPRVKSMRMPIFQLDELIAIGKEFSVIIGHSRYEYITTLKKCFLIKNVWCLTGALRDDIDISEEFVIEHLMQFETTYDTFSDNLSRRNMVGYLNAKITGENQYIIDLFDEASTYFCNDLIKFNNGEIYLDLGAYDGKSIVEFIEACPSFQKIVAVEVQPDMYKFLQKKFNEDSRISIKNIGVSDHIGIDYFNFDDQSTCLTDNVSGTPVEVLTVDELCAELQDVSIMKICIGNTVVPLLKGAKKVINKYKPKLVIAAGIDNRALIDYVPLIKALSGDGYKYYLRFTNAMAEAMVLFAIPIMAD